MCQCATVEQAASLQDGAGVKDPKSLGGDLPGIHSPTIHLRMKCTSLMDCKFRSAGKGPGHFLLMVFHYTVILIQFELIQLLR